MSVSTALNRESGRPSLPVDVPVASSIHFSTCKNHTVNKNVFKANLIHSTKACTKVSPQQIWQMRSKGTWRGVSVTVYSNTGRPSVARAASATCRCRSCSSSSMPASKTSPTCSSPPSLSTQCLWRRYYTLHNLACLPIGFSKLSPWAWNSRKKVQK